MSNHLAIATVTAALRDMLQSAAARAVDGADVTIKRPAKAASDGQEAAAVNIYLYQVTPNTTWRNADLPTRGGNGALRQRPQAALDLHYLLSFYGNDLAMEPQRLLGSVIAALHAQPLLSPERIRMTLRTATDDVLAQETVLADSDLAEQVAGVRFTPINLSLEELSKLWSVFFQVPYVLSVAYQASVVLIEAEKPPAPSLPVRKRELHLRAGPPPVPETEPVPRVVLHIPGTVKLAGGLEVQVEPAVHHGQQVRLLLNEVQGERACTLDPTAQWGIPDEVTESNTVSFPLLKKAPTGEKRVALVEPGTYLVRLQVDGVDSLLDWDEGSGFSGPTVEIGE
jgi:hypothetical protein